MPFWEEWTEGKVVESQIRHSVNGDGKSSLDGMFGKLGQNLKDAVENGITDISDARSCLKAYDEGAGIEGTSAFLLQIERENDMEVVKKAQQPILLRSHRIVHEPNKNRVIAYCHSDYGNGTEIDVDALKCMIKGSPDKPKYTVSSTSEGAAGTAHHPTESYQSRNQRKTMSKRQAANDALIAKQQALVDKAMLNGQLCCGELDTITKSICLYHCTSKKTLEEHKKSGKHHFPSRNLTDHAIAFASMEGGKFVYGSRANRNQAHANHDVSDGKGPANSSDAHFSVGCYCKPSREKSKPFSNELRRILIEMFEAGESSNGEDKRGKNKYTPKAALDKLCSMRNKAGLLKFSSTSKFGELPTESQIKAFWYRYKESRNKKSDSNDEQNKDDEYVNAALEADVDEESDDKDKEEPESRSQPTKKRRAARKKNKEDKKGKFDGKTFVVSGNFEASIGDEDNAISIEEWITSHGGKVLQRQSKTVGKTFLFIYYIYISLYFAFLHLSERK